MRVLTAALMILALGGPAFAQTEHAPKPGPAPAACHADGKACAPARHRKKKSGGQDGLKAQSFTRCRDVRTHSATKCGGPYAEPLPTD